MKKAIAILLIAVLALTCFAACGKKDDGKAEATVEGVYTVKTVNDKPVEEYFSEMAAEEGMSLEDMIKFLGIDSINEAISIELKADGTFSLVYGPNNEEGTWVQNGEKLTLTVDNEPLDTTLKDGELTLDVDGVSLVLVKK